jgi:predicted nucleic acid-binding protein
VRAALLDAGPVVALVYRPDSHRAAAVAALRASAAAGRRICTTWEAVGEAYTLLRLRVAPDRASHALAVLHWAWDAGVIVIGTTEEDHERAMEILGECPAQRLSYFDGLLLATAERHEVEEVITVDGAHFQAVQLRQEPVITVV